MKNSARVQFFTVKLSRGANREAVFDLAESLWLSGEKRRAVTNFELATQSENTAIQSKAHIRLAHAFLDTGELNQVFAVSFYGASVLIVPENAIREYS